MKQSLDTLAAELEALKKIISAQDEAIATIRTESDRTISLQSKKIAAQDETIEAISLKDYDGFFFGVQWHPETSATTDDFSMKLFDSFNSAVQTFSIEK